MRTVQHTFPKHGDLRGSDRWDNLSKSWVRADEWQERQWAREDAAFARKANQGELTTPAVIFDSMKPVRSQANGLIYDSKSAIRAHYRRDGFIEVGNDVPKERFVNGRQRPDQKAKIAEAMGKAQAAVETMSDETIARRQWERANKPL